MIYYTAKEIINALIYSFGLGSFLGIFSVCTDVIFDFFTTLFHMLIKIKSLENRKEKRAYFKSIRRLQTNKDKRLLFIKDILFSCVTGVLLSFLFYIANDGEIRMFVLALVLISFLLCKKAFGKSVGKLIDFVFVLTLKFTLNLLMILLVPLRFCVIKAGAFVKRMAGKNTISRQKRKTENKGSEISNKKIVQNGVKTRYF